MEDAGFGDTHNDLRSAASQLSGVWTVLFLWARESDPDRVRHGHADG